MCNQVRHSAWLIPLLVLTAFGQPVERKPPVSLEELTALISEPEAERPSKDIAARIVSLGTEFRMSPEIDTKLRQAATTMRRPEDGVRVVLQAAEANWIYDQIGLMVRRPDGIEKLADTVRERGLELPYDQGIETVLRRSGGDEPAFTLLWPPLQPPAPRAKAQLWRVVTENVQPVPIRFNPDRASGEIELDVKVDGAVMFVPKHGTLFYNVFCGADVQVLRAQFSSPVPRLPVEQMEWDVQMIRKGRGKVFACPQDPACSQAMEDKRKNKTQVLCSWQDTDGTDGHGYPNVRFVIQDEKSGAETYSVRFRWAMKPYTLEQVKEELARWGPERMVNKIYQRAVSFKPDAQAEADLRAAGATQRLLDEIIKIGRVSNLPRPK